jgi:hypothetical protein
MAQAFAWNIPGSSSHAIVQGSCSGAPSDPYLRVSWRLNAVSMPHAARATSWLNALMRSMRAGVAST